MNIYKIENKINGKVYIGQTKQDVSKRIYMHTKRDSHIGRALRKHGIATFDISVIDTAESEEILDEKEKNWIKYYDCRSPNGYNHTNGGDGLTNPSEDVRKKMSETKRANPWHPSEEARRKMSLASKGKPKSEQHKINMRKPKSEAGRENIRKSAARPEVRKKHAEAMIGNKNCVRKPNNDSVAMVF
jgi:group I intron endonuclease